MSTMHKADKYTVGNRPEGKPYPRTKKVHIEIWTRQYEVATKLGKGMKRL